MRNSCPRCGGISRKASIDPNVIITTTPRICDACGHQFALPLPRWIGLIALLFSFALFVAILYEGIFPQPDWPYRVTWSGRLAVLFIAGLLVVMGGGVLLGNTRTILSSPIPNLDDIHTHAKGIRARYPILKYIDALVGLVILVLMLLWFFK